MPFVESSKSLKSKLHMSRVSMPVLAGIVALFMTACALAVQNVTHVLGEDAFAVVQDADGSMEESDAVGNGAAEETNQSQSTSFAAGDGTDDAVAETTATSYESPEDAQSTQDGQQTGPVVFVSGCVRSPGVFDLERDARVEDAVLAAGGFTEDASTDAVNLARIVQDGEQIRIPSIEDVEAGYQEEAESHLSQTDMNGDSETDGPINVNTADSAQLQELPGIGEATAAKIISSREQDGPFASKEDLMRVSGIGEKKFAAIEDLIIV